MASEKSNGQLKELEDKLLRLYAELDNYRKRAEKEKIETAKRSKASLVLALLPVLDDFELALKQNDDKNEFRSGIELVYKNFLSVLKKEGLEEMKLEGEKFDPYLHEAVKVEDGEDGKILSVIQKGYFLDGKVLRHAKVVVGRKKDSENDAKTTLKNDANK